MGEFNRNPGIAEFLLGRASFRDCSLGWSPCEVGTLNFRGGVKAYQRISNSDACVWMIRRSDCTGDGVKAEVKGEKSPELTS